MYDATWSLQFSLKNTFCFFCFVFFFLFKLRIDCCTRATWLDLLVGHAIKRWRKVDFSVWQLYSGVYNYYDILVYLRLTRRVFRSIMQLRFSVNTRSLYYFKEKKFTDSICLRIFIQSKHDEVLEVLNNLSSHLFHLNTIFLLLSSLPKSRTIILSQTCS